MPYEFDGRKYEQASLPQKEMGYRIITALPLRGNEHILDLGCGDGALSARLAKMVPQGRVIGIDASEGMLKVAQTYAGGNLKFFRMDVNAMTFEKEFDLVFSNAALHWIKDHHDLLDRIYRALRPGGGARLNFAAAGNCEIFFQTIKTAMTQIDFADYFRNFSWPWLTPSPEQYQRIVAVTAFRNARITIMKQDYYFPNGDKLVAWIDTSGLTPFLTVLPENLRSLFRDYVITRMLAETKQSDGRFLIPFRRLNVEAARPQ